MSTKPPLSSADVLADAQTSTTARAKDITATTIANEDQIVELVALLQR